MTPPPRAPRGEARREAIVEATLRILGDHGTGAVTHRRVAAEAGVPLAATTYWFASKDDLLVAACRLASERDAARLERAASELAARPATDLAEGLTDLLTAELAESRPALIALYALWLEAARSPALREVTDSYTAVYLRAVRGLLARAGSPDPDTDARVLVAAIDGVLLEQLPGGPGRDPGAAMRPVLERLVAALVRA